MALRLIYQMFTTLLGWIVLRTRSDTTKEIEILVLRQLSVLQLRTPRPRMTWTDRVWVPRTVTRPLTRAFRASGPTSPSPSTARVA